ncbi:MULTISPECIES: geranylgeranylglycerol-phosphate geranylgeranyltransferase [Croceibacter]|uniref:geranylgeranylglycerol-phosphate geranylgeranyltransferase n=1 Tax=Croceibacter TaxID=216431 RepID=UPI000C37F038|nr:MULTISPECIES: geranylgeranylglycerol-phosphate geranylgeranyltransferase [Croceibacter]MBG25071.1 prenyltransferase [Croceibacter sp.]
MKYLKLFRYQNLIFVILTQVFLRYFLFEPFGITITLSDFGYALLVLATVCLTAAGNVINDIYDVETDQINKPEHVLVGKSISEQSAYTLFIILNVIAVGIGFYLSNIIGKPGFSALFISISAILYIYASYLKRTVLVGNLVISLLVAFVIIVVAIYDLMPAITPQNKAVQTLIFGLMLDYAVFAFAVNLIREMIKDQQDVKGDHNSGIQTLPIILGKTRTNKVIFSVTALLIIGLIYYLYTYMFQNQVAVLYVLFLILGPLLYVLIKIWNADTKHDYRKLSGILKLVMLFGVISMAFYQFML